MAGEDSGIR